ncbi:MAG: SpoIIE family protein phosphatase [Polyangiaceae bacterium]|nr:SpoIIE family protein phosphatase [Polyangiaceae bacterium]
MRFAHRSKPCKGEKANGDRAVVIDRDGVVLLAVVDGLGHGPAASLAADAAERTLDAAKVELSLEELFKLVDRALRGTRGAAMTALRIAKGELEAAAIGNVGFRSTASGIPLVWTPGILGQTHRPLRVGRCAAPKHGRLLLFSDGISSRFRLDSLDTKSPERACEELLASHALPHDDATALIMDL